MAQLAGPPAAISRISFTLPVDRKANAEFREALMQFSATYHISGHAIGHFGEFGSAHYQITVPTGCQHAERVLEQIMRGAAPVERISDYLELARPSLQCVRR